MNEKQARALATVGAFTVTGVGTLALNGGPWGAVLTGAAAIITWHQGDVLYHMTRAMVLGEEVELVEKLVSASPSYAVHEDQRPMAKLKRLVGKASTQPPSHPATQPDTLLIGYDRHGKEVRKSWKELKAILILGTAGGGKTSTAAWLISQVCQQGGIIAIIDKHGKSEESLTYKVSPFEAFFACEPGITPEQALQVVRLASDTLDRREEDGSIPDYPFFLVVDEFSQIMKYTKQKGAWSEVAEALSDVVERFNTGGRKYKCFALCIGQIVNATRTGGTEVRDLFNTRIVHGMKESQAETLGLTEYKKDICNLNHGQIFLDMEGKDNPFFVQVPYISDKAIRSMAKQCQAMAVDSYTNSDIEVEEGYTTGINGVEAFNREYTNSDIEVEEEYTTGINEVEVFNHEGRNKVNGYTSSDIAINLNVPTLVPVIPDKGRRAEEIENAVAIALWNAGYNSRRKLAKSLGITENQAARVMTNIGVTQPSTQPMKG